MSLYKHVPHPHIARRKESGPVRVADQSGIAHKNPVVRFNARLALFITLAVGSMWCAYGFAGLAVAGLPTALKPGNIGLLYWISGDLLQLTLLSVIIVGQNIQAQAADKRAEQTYQDAEAVLHEALQIQQHLAAQDAATGKLGDQLAGLAEAVREVMAARVEHESGVAADAKAARSAAESAFVACQSLAAVAMGGAAAGGPGTAGKKM